MNSLNPYEAKGLGRGIDPFLQKMLMTPPRQNPGTMVPNPLQAGKFNPGMMPPIQGQPGRPAGGRSMMPNMPMQMPQQSQPMRRGVGGGSPGGNLLQATPLMNPYQRR